MSSAQPIHWGAEALWEDLVQILPGLSIEVIPRVGSTNTALLERARAVPDTRSGDPDVLVRRSVESGAFGRRAVDQQPVLLVAEQQTAGRGRQGRGWQSSAGASLTFSLCLPMAATEWSGLSLAVGVALADALDPTDPAAPGLHMGLKWPNDLWLMDGPVRRSTGGRKLGGILIETVAARAGQDPAGRLVVVGVGLNVLAFEAGDTRTGFATLSELDAGATAPTVLARVVRPLIEALKRFEKTGFAGFASRYAERDLLHGHVVSTTLPHATEGVAAGVSEDGALRVDTPTGRVAVSSGEVSVRLDPATPC